MTLLAQLIYNRKSEHYQRGADEKTTLSYLGYEGGDNEEETEVVEVRGEGREDGGGEGGGEVGGEGGNVEGEGVGCQEKALLNPTPTDTRRNL